MIVCLVTVSGGLIDIKVVPALLVPLAKRFLKHTIKLYCKMACGKLSIHLGKRREVGERQELLGTQTWPGYVKTGTRKEMTDTMFCSSAARKTQMLNQPFLSLVLYVWECQNTGIKIRVKCPIWYKQGRPRFRMEIQQMARKVRIENLRVQNSAVKFKISNSGAWGWACSLDSLSGPYLSTTQKNRKRKNHLLTHLITLKGNFQKIICERIRVGDWETLSEGVGPQRTSLRLGVVASRLNCSLGQLNLISEC